MSDRKSWIGYQEAAQLDSETFKGNPKDYMSAGTMSPKQDAEDREPASQNDKGNG